MSKKVTTLNFSDVSGELIPRETGELEYPFSLGGAFYEIDLTDEDLARLHNIMGPYTLNAHKVAPPKGARKAKVKKAPNEEPKPQTLSIVPSAPALGSVATQSLSASEPEQKAKPAQTEMNAAGRAAVRDWANRNGHKVGPRGRIAQGVLDDFNLHHPPTKSAAHG